MPFYRYGPKYKGKGSAIYGKGAIGSKENRTGQRCPAEIFNIEDYAEDKEKQKKWVCSQKTVSVESYKIKLPV